MLVALCQIFLAQLPPLDRIEIQPSEVFAADEPVPSYGTFPFPYVFFLAETGTGIEFSFSDGLSDPPRASYCAATLPETGLDQQACQVFHHNPFTVTHRLASETVALTYFNSSVAGTPANHYPFVLFQPESSTSLSDAKLPAAPMESINPTPNLLMDFMTPDVGPAYAFAAWMAQPACQLAAVQPLPTTSDPNPEPILISGLSCDYLIEAAFHASGHLYLIGLSVNYHDLYAVRYDSVAFKIDPNTGHIIDYQIFGHDQSLLIYDANLVNNTTLICLGDAHNADENTLGDRMSFFAEEHDLNRLSPQLDLLPFNYPSFSFGKVTSPAAVIKTPSCLGYMPQYTQQGIEILMHCVGYTNPIVLDVVVDGASDFYPAAALLDHEGSMWILGGYHPGTQSFFTPPMRPFVMRFDQFEPTVHSLTAPSSHTRP